MEFVNKNIITLDKETFADRITALTSIGSIYVSSVVRQITFKRLISSIKAESKKNKFY